MELVITPEGTAKFVYQEEVDLARLGRSSIQRASHVEPDEHGQWWADLRPTSGPVLGPFVLRTDAVRAETAWIISELSKALTVMRF